MGVGRGSVMHYRWLVASAVCLGMWGGIWAGKAQDRWRIDVLPLYIQPHILSIPELIVQCSSVVGISAHLPLGVAYTESRWRDIYRENGGDLYLGPMQISTRVALKRGLDASALLDYRYSTYWGVVWLKEWAVKCGGTDVGIALAYRMGRCPTQK